MKRNTFSKALKHLKSTELDEKIQRLNEAPTNSMSGVYSLNDPGFRLGGVDEYDPERVFYPDVDGNWPAGIPGTPGDDTYTRPAGFWSGGTDWDTIHVSDLSQAYLDVDATGTSTSSLIESDGTVKTPLPPNSRNFILGPLVDGYVYNHGYDDFTNIGYLQKDTRQFVLLASIPGHWDSNLRPSGFTPRQWDGSTITIYNANFTLAMADWFSDKITSNNYTENVPYFYSGGIPQIPQSPADCPKCPPNMKGGNGAGGAGAGWGSGGNSNQGSKQGNPKKGGPGDANLWGLNSKTGKKEKLSAKDYAAYKAGGGDAAAKKGKSINDVIAQGKKNLGQYDSTPKSKNPLENTIAGNIIKELGRAFQLATGAAVDAKSYNTQLATNLFTSIITGKPIPIKLNQSAKSDMIKNINVNNFAKALEFGKPPVPSAGNATNPGNKQNVFTGSWGSQGGSEVHYDPKTDTLTFTSNKMLRTGQSGDQFDGGRQTSFGDIPPPNPKVVQQKVTQLIQNPAIDAFLSGLGYVTNIATGQIQSKYPLNSNNKVQAQNPWDQIKNDPNLLKDFNNSLSKAASEIATGTVQGTASNAVAMRQFLTNLGVPQSGQEQMGGGYGQVYSQTSYKGNEIPQNIKDIINKKLNENNNYLSNKQTLTEDHKRILHEIKQPVKIKEPQIQKLTKYKPNFAGRYTAQNTPDVTASPESDAMVKAKNAAGQTWRTKDKYWSGYETTERMNIVFDNVGHGSQYWDKIVNENQMKKVIRDRQVQEHLNIIAHEKAMLREDPFYESPFKNQLEEQETLQADKDPLFRKVKNRLKPIIDYPDKPAKDGYPDQPPPEMVNGFHPDYGEKADYYNALDPQSADAMPTTGNPEIDAKVDKARRLKRALGKKI